MENEMVREHPLRLGIIAKKESVASFDACGMLDRTTDGLATVTIAFHFHPRLKTEQPPLVYDSSYSY